MIDFAFYTKKITEANMLLNNQLSKEVIALIYKKIKDNYENIDFDKAIFSAVSEENISYPNLVKWLDYYQELRIESQQKEAKKKEKQEIKKLLKKEEKEDCRYNRQCLTCKIEYCSIVSNYVFRNVVMPILTGENKLNVLKKASEDFPEIFKKIYDRHKGGKE